MPSKRSDALGSDVDVRVCLVARQSASVCIRGGRIAYLDSVQHLDDSRVPQRAELSQRVLCKRQQALLCCAIEREYAAVGTILLLLATISSGDAASATSRPAYPPCSIVQRPD